MLNRADPMSLLSIINRSLPNAQFKLVFDVGANSGSSLKQFAAWWPEATIHSFEPISATFAELMNAAAMHPSAQCHQVALSNKCGTGTMTKELSKMNRLVGNTWKKGAVEEVSLERGDDFCDRLNVERINFLKVDTEGNDLNVLVGFSRMLSDQRIDLLQVEAGLNPHNEAHVPLSKFIGYLEPFGYRLFYLADQILERKRPVLRRCNASFISEAAISKNSIPQ